jgi:hypothetical protein
VKSVVRQTDQTNLEEKPHETSVAVWDVPSPVAINSRFKVRVGLTCSATCQLTGHVVEVRDDTGTTVGHGTLGEKPWEGTHALYWADVELTAPATVGLTFWTVHFSPEGMESSHTEASHPFSFKADHPPEHCVTIKVTAIDTDTPIGAAEVRLGAYRTATDNGGLATFDIPKGAYDLKIWSDGYEGPPMTVEVTQDVAIEVQAIKTLTAAEREERHERYEANQWG